MSYTLRYISFAEVGSVCRVPLREPMHLCTCMSEEGDDGEAPCPVKIYLEGFSRKRSQETRLGTTGLWEKATEKE